ncbi:MAG: RdgB/HAM1 family non-canonical purine NTP pyrophosphatase [Candidatus Omnitrophica bacterium]|nr:RdgB/HAM1 family non-canonical purine NTP pyrophosphatase [Candidatus Omnitrophota bacterium]
MKRKELIVATKNKKKFKEIKEILKNLGLDLRIRSLLSYKNLPRILEDGKNFKENAIKKATRIAKLSGKLTLGEDSGLEVEALDGLPGVYSARFAGKDKSDLNNNLKILRLMEKMPLHKRKARYVCTVALADKEGLIAVKEGSCQGLIGFKMQGRYGFGYDPLFIIPKYKKTFAQLGPKVKHKMSHRFKALKKLKNILKSYFKN